MTGTMIFQRRGVILYRVPFDAAKGWRRERRGVYLTNLALAVSVGGLGISLGYARVASSR
jgi:acyl-lipid omega-6 desaturase (Delta-12 desaturase)